MRRLFHSFAKTSSDVIVVSVENGAGPMATDCHRNAFTDTNTDHVAHGRSPEVMKDACRNHHNLFLAVDQLRNWLRVFV
jgi:hypothetical protein